MAVSLGYANGREPETPEEEYQQIEHERFLAAASKGVAKAMLDAQDEMIRATREVGGVMQKWKREQDPDADL